MIAWPGVRPYPRGEIHSPAHTICWGGAGGYDYITRYRNSTLIKVPPPKSGLPNPVLGLALVLIYHPLTDSYHEKSSLAPGT